MPLQEGGSTFRPEAFCRLQLEEEDLGIEAGVERQGSKVDVPSGKRRQAQVLAGIIPRTIVQVKQVVSGHYHSDQLKQGGEGHDPNGDEGKPELVVEGAGILQPENEKVAHGRHGGDQQDAANRLGFPDPTQ